MGELHLDIYIERMKREYKCEVDVESPRQLPRVHHPARHLDYLHKKQSGGSGQYGRVVGYVEPLEEGNQTWVENGIIGNAISPGYILACDKGFKEAAQTGGLGTPWRASRLAHRRRVARRGLDEMAFKPPRSPRSGRSSRRPNPRFSSR